MKEETDRADYFTKHLFRTGLGCLTKLYYKAKDYPESREGRPFIEHAILNKKLLKSLVHSIYPSGKFINGRNISQSAEQTKRLLNSKECIVFDAIFTHKRMMARLPVVLKSGDHLTVMHIQTKAFNARKHSLLDRNGKLHSKWRKYLFDFAYQLYILQEEYPDFSVLPLLVLPDKSSYAQSSELPGILKPFESESIASDIPTSNQQLLVKLDVSDPLKKIWQDSDFADEHFQKGSFEETLFYLRDIYLMQERVDPEVGTKCKECEFRIASSRVEEGEISGFKECWEPQKSVESESDHIFDLIGAGTQKWLDEGKYFQQDIEEESVLPIKFITESTNKISAQMRQSLQIHKAKGRSVPEEILRPPLIKELRRWEYPIHFLDFEAGNYAVPVRKNRPPYHLVVFQFSCHTLQKNGEWQHHQWLDNLGSVYPNYELVRRLMKVPNINKGTIVQYSNFERNALKIIRRELRDESEIIPDSKWLIQWIKTIIKRNDSKHAHPPYVADLSRQVKDYYYNREMEDSLSIKDVLQSVMTQSDFLKQKYSKPYSSHNFDDVNWWQPDKNNKARNPYDILAERSETLVQRGTEAMVCYGKLLARDLSKSQREAYRNSLLRYCELDTLAMMMIYEHWKGELNQLY